MDQNAIQDKVDKTELEIQLQTLEEEIAKNRIPIRTTVMFIASKTPVGYLSADSTPVSRSMYLTLFVMIGTTFGEGDGSTTFNLPNLVGRFAKGGTTPGTVKEAGLPNITGTFRSGYSQDEKVNNAFVGAFYDESMTNTRGAGGIETLGTTSFDASLSNAIYGAADTVQPPALTLLPCIKAFDAIADTALIDVSALAQETAGKVDRTVNGKNIAYVIDSWRSGAAYWRLWSDGWLEQGGTFGPIGIASTGHRYETINLFKPYDDQAFRVVLVPLGEPYLTPATCLYDEQTTTSIKVGGQDWDGGYVYWYTCGMAVPS